jgi:aryl-alcohol dehydrogenase
LVGISGGAGADGIVETTGNTAVLRQGVDALAARGTLVIVGAPPFGSEVSLDVNGMLPGRRVVGLTLGDSETQSLIPGWSPWSAKAGCPSTGLSPTTHSKTSAKP